MDEGENRYMKCFKLFYYVNDSKSLYASQGRIHMYVIILSHLHNEIRGTWQGIIERQGKMGDILEISESMGISSQFYR